MDRNLRFKRDSAGFDETAMALLGACHIRFLTFEAKFNRPPGLHDPLFFDEHASDPVPSKPEIARMQLREAAKIAGVDDKLALSFFDSPRTARTSRRASTWSSSDGLHRSQTLRVNLLNKPRSGSFQLARFLKDARLHRRYKITAEELKALAGTSFLGNVCTEKDF